MNILIIFIFEFWSENEIILLNVAKMVFLQGPNGGTSPGPCDSPAVSKQVVQIIQLKNELIIRMIVDIIGIIVSNFVVYI